MFTGWAEVLAGLLLIVPRTAVLGALVCLADMIQVLVLNLTYDIGLKLISSHIILITVYVLLPHGRPLARVFLGTGPVEPLRPPDIFAIRRASGAALVVQLVAGAYLCGMFTSISVSRWYSEGGGSPRSALYGIWNVQELLIDGRPANEGETDYDRRWRRVLFDRPRTVVFQRTDDSFARYGAAIDTSRRWIELTKGNSRSWRATFSYVQPAADRLILDGDMDGYRLRLGLERVELDTFRVVHRGFRWVRPPDFIQD
jgi:hypothetical protein